MYTFYSEKNLKRPFSQVTPTLSRVDTPPSKSQTPPPPEEEQIVLPPVSRGPSVEQIIRSVPSIDLNDFDQNSSISLSEHDSSESTEELNDIIPINSNQHIELLSDPLSSTRLDDEAEEEGIFVLKIF